MAINSGLIRSSLTRQFLAHARTAAIGRAPEEEVQALGADLAEGVRLGSRSAGTEAPSSQTRMFGIAGASAPLPNQSSVTPLLQEQQVTL